MKISIIGAGSVGSTIAYTLMVKNLASEIILVDLNQKKLEGEVWDLNDGSSFSKIENIKIGKTEDVKDSDVIILTAGIPQKVGETRLDLISKNKAITESIFKEIGQIKPTCIIIVVSNPVDIVTYLTQEICGLPHNQVFGTGTCLDTARLKLKLAEHFNVNSSQIEGFVLGEHGDSEFIAWSTVRIEGEPIDSILSDEEKKKIENDIKNRAYEIIARKNATFYGIAMTTIDILEAILFNQNKILPVSSRLINDKEEYSSVCLGNLNIIGNNGIVRSWPVNLNEEEENKMNESINLIKNYL